MFGILHPCICCFASAHATSQIILLTLKYIMYLNEMTAKSLGISSFTSVGHLLHINLKEHLVQTKHEIGKALLEKNPRALAVVNKINSIDNTYRNFELEIIAKRDDCTKSDEELMIVEVHENKCRFKLDFSKVYWNSRLSTEHERIVAKLHKPCDIVFDLFAGVGPFSVPAAKAKCKTYANDLNPESYAWLSCNMKYNKVPKHFYELTNLDAKDYILDELKPKLFEEYEKVDDEQLATKPTIHIIMNLPALAPTFLSNFVGLFKEEEANKFKINDYELTDLFREQALDHIVYCYCFLKGVYENPKAEIRSMIEQNLGRPLTDEQLVNIFRVRNVAPYKDMYRVEFKLDSSILFDHKNVTSIMKNNTNRLSNGTSKKVTIQAPAGKRSHQDSLDESIEQEDETNRKKSKWTVSFTENCIII